MTKSLNLYDISFEFQGALI